MTDPHGPPPPGWDQGGGATAGATPPPAGRYPEAAQNPEAAQYPETAQYIETAQYQPPGPSAGGGYGEGQQYPAGPYAGQYAAGQYAGTPYTGAPYPGAQYPGAQYPGAQYPGAQYPGTQYPGTQYPGTQYPGAQYPDTAYPPPAGRPPGTGGPNPGRAKRMWIIIVAAVAAVAIVAAVVVVVLLNRAPDPNTPIAQGASTAPVAIPDDTPSGVTSPIVLAGDASVGRLDVVLTLRHLFPRELTAVLTAPGGRQAVVFARADVAGRLALTTTDPASPLRNLLGGPVAGTWSLTVSDEVSADSGTVEGWEITAYPAASDARGFTAERATGTSSPALAIPDADPLTGVTDAIDLGGYGTVDRVVVSVAITHDVSEDLLVELRSPQGGTVVLSDAVAALGPAIRLDLDSSQPGSPLAALVGEPLAGPWQLRIYDGVGIDLGTLDSWEITVNG